MPRPPARSRRRAATASGAAEGGGEGVADPRVAGLLRADPEGFVAARTALARELSAAGEGALAARVARLRRPTLATVVLNRLAVDDPDEVARLLDASARLRARGAPGAVREAGEAQRAALSALLAAAEQIAIDLGHDASALLLGKVERGLRAAASGGEELRRALSAGVLEREPEPGEIDLVAGLETLAAGGTPPATSTRTPTPPATSTRTPTPTATSTEPVRPERSAGAAGAKSRDERATSARDHRLAAQHEVQRALREVESAEKALAAARARLAEARRAARGS